MKTRLLTPRSKGFTLIEVLVVIAIIALLSGVSYSIYSHATETAARTRCTDNLRRISDWGKEFAGQNGGKLPSSGMKDSLLSARECRNWWDALAPIVNAEQPDLIARNAKEPNMLPDTFRCKNASVRKSSERRMPTFPPGRTPFPTPAGWTTGRGDP